MAFAVLAVVITLVPLACRDLPESEMEPCDACGISLQLVTRIDSDEVDWSANVVERDGYVYFSPRSQEYRIFRADSEGTVVASYGRKGRGPGELQSVGSIVFHEEEIHVIDGPNTSYLRLTPALELIEAVSTDFMGQERGLVITPSGSLITTADHAPGVPPAKRILRFSEDGSIQAGIGPPQPGRERIVIVGESDVEDIWLCDYGTRIVQRWDPVGDTLVRAYHLPPWPYEVVSSETARPAPGTPEGPRRMTPPPHAIVDFWQDGDHLWIVSRLTIRDFQPGTTARGNTLFDAMIEVLDIRSGEVIHTFRSPEFLLGFAAPGKVFSYVESPEGVPSIFIYSISLEGE